MKKGWQTKHLGDVAAVGAGNSAPQDEALFEDGTIPFFRTADAGRVRFGDINESTDYLNDKGVKGLRRFAPGTILFPKSGASTFLNHRVMLGAEGCVSSHLATIVADEKQAHPRFLLYFLSTIAAQDLVQDHAYPSLNLPTIAGIEVHLPPLAEQQRIVGLLDEAFEGLATAKANAEKNLQNARALFESNLQSVFTQRGPGWVEKRLDELCTFSSGGTPSKVNSSYWQGEVPWVSGRDMKSTRLSDSALHISQAAVDESATRMASAGTLLILVRGMGLAHGAQIAELLVPCAFNQDIRGIQAKPGLLPRYLLFALRDGINSSDTVLSNAAHGTLKIDSNELQKVMIPFPPLEQQKKIVAVIDALTEETQRLARLYERKYAALEALKKSLLHQAFNREL